MNFHTSLWRGNETWDDFTNKMKAFITNECSDVVDAAIYQSQVVWDIEEYSANYIIMRHSK